MDIPQTDRQTDRHVNSLTNSARGPSWWKICLRKTVTKMWSQKSTRRSSWVPRTCQRWLTLLLFVFLLSYFFYDYFNGQIGHFSTNPRPHLKCRGRVQWLSAAVGAMVLVLFSTNFQEVECSLFVEFLGTNPFPTWTSKLDIFCLFILRKKKQIEIYF